MSRAGGAATSAEVELDVGRLHLEVSIVVEPGEVLAVLGPNGSGKTTLLRVLAGLLAVDRGHVVVGGAVVDDPGSGRFVLPEHRRVGMVFQDHLLFPHLDLLDNVAFGLRATGAGRDAARSAATTWLDRVGLAGLERSRPRAVSGGQAQRAAVARALVTEPALMLLDEPLSALDVGTRTSLRRDLRTHLTDFGGATALVTHDALDALALADRVVVIEDGSITQSGPLDEVAGSPRTPYIADLMGTNLLAGRAAGNEVVIDGGRATVVVGEPHDGPVLVLVRPSSVTLHRDVPKGSPRNRWPVRVVGFDPLGERVRVRLDGPISLSAEVTPAAIAELGLVDGSDVWAAVKATDTSVVDR